MEIILFFFFFLGTFDFSSLQARLASIDTCLNDDPDRKFYSPETYGLMPDPVLLDVYKDGSTVSDLHSMTGFNTFVKSVNMKAIRVHDDVDNKDYVFAPISRCRIMRNNKEETVYAKDLQENDHIIEHL